ncbi:hypothetical protein M413DRAFT_449103 [Hebeloma cylindrosporum]|uniref:Uncharacterized protein n=1 Tax=Hebeloma cylindrosporum TaxID=76867 RepID=A0A0C3BWW1_HEBCY|nr:hypothetical protein M413DRAFT_449103 [Hebeloma cylindrosporum h7]
MPPDGSLQGLARGGLVRCGLTSNKFPWTEKHALVNHGPTMPERPHVPSLEVNRDGLNQRLNCRAECLSSGPPSDFRSRISRCAHPGNLLLSMRVRRPRENGKRSPSTG